MQTIFGDVISSCTGTRNGIRMRQQLIKFFGWRHTLSESASTVENDAADIGKKEEDVGAQEEDEAALEENVAVQEEASAEITDNLVEESPTNVVEIVSVASRDTIGGGEVWYRINYYTESFNDPCTETACSICVSSMTELSLKVILHGICTPSMAELSLNDMR